MKSIIVTGAGKGIGRSIAESLIKASDIQLPLVFVSRSKSDLQELEAMALSYQKKCFVYAFDLASLEAQETFWSDFHRRGLSSDTVIHNAGVGAFGDQSEITEEQFDHVMNTNAKGLFFFAQKTLTEMIQNASKIAECNGHQLFITSVAAHRGFPQLTLYCMSKYAQRGLIESLRSYGYQHKIKITEIAPGAVLTPMWGDAVSNSQGEKMMRPSDIADAVLTTLRLPSRSSLETVIVRPIQGDL